LAEARSAVAFAGGFVVCFRVSGDRAFEVAMHLTCPARPT
jgi:hypothetical protein